jgi:hypothetical protein
VNAGSDLGGDVPRWTALAIAAASLATACQTITPLQTASTVETGTWRLGGQISASPWCSLTLDPAGNCYMLPDNVPIGELRLAARTGLVPRVDAGLSIHGSGVVARSFRIGGLMDAKVELWSVPARSGRHLIAAGAGIGAAREGWISSQGVTQFTPELELVVPVFYGYQSEKVELVASPRYFERFSYIDITGDGRRESLEERWVGLSLSAYARGPRGWALALEYAAPTAGLHRGALTASGGLFFDIGAGRDPKAGGAQQESVNSPPR